MIVYLNLICFITPLKIFKDAPRTNFSTEQKIFISVVLKKVTGTSLNIFKGFYINIYKMVNILKWLRTHMVFFLVQRK